MAGPGHADTELGGSMAAADDDDVPFHFQVLRQVYVQPGG